jgi:hypothetical protein
MTKQFHELALISVPELTRFDPATENRTLILAQAAAECLTQFGLCKTDLEARFHAEPARFEVLLGDLTDEGLAFARGGFQRWLANTDRWKADATLERFRSALAKQWEKSRANAP